MQGVEVGAGVVAVVELAVAQETEAAHVAGVGDGRAAPEEALDEDFKADVGEERVHQLFGGQRYGRVAAAARGVADGDDAAAAGTFRERGGMSGVLDEDPLCKQRAAGGERAGEFRDLGARTSNGKMVAYDVEHTKILLKG